MYEREELEEKLIELRDLHKHDSIFKEEERTLKAPRLE